jgi:hypothetical protein
MPVLCMPIASFYRAAPFAHVLYRDPIGAYARDAEASLSRVSGRRFPLQGHSAVLPKADRDGYHSPGC